MRMVTPDGKKNRQASYMVKFMIKVIVWYKENGENKHETSQHFGIDSKECENGSRKKIVFEGIGLERRMNKSAK